jgi:hypothetical protein
VVARELFKGIGQSTERSLMTRDFTVSYVFRAQLDSLNSSACPSLGCESSLQKHTCGQGADGAFRRHRLGAWLGHADHTPAAVDAWGPILFRLRPVAYRLFVVVQKTWLGESERTSPSLVSPSI